MLTIKNLGFVLLGFQYYLCSVDSFTSAAIMVSVEDGRSNLTTKSSSSRWPQTRPYFCYSPSQSSVKSLRSNGRSMRTVRSNFYQTDDRSENFSENLTDSVIDIRLREFASKPSHSNRSSFCEEIEFLEASRAFSDLSSSCSSDISGELELLAGAPDPSPDGSKGEETEPEHEPCAGFLQRDSFSTEIIECIEPEDLQPTVKLCVDGLNSPSVAVKRSAAAKLRLLAKNRTDNRALIGESGAVQALIPLLRCSADPATQEHAVTALLNLSLHEPNKNLITKAGGVKSLIYALKTGTETSKQNAACALLSLALIDDNKLSIGVCGAIPPLVALLINGTNRGKKDALTTLYKLCSVGLNKERAVSAGAVRPLVGMVNEKGTGMAEKAMVVLSSLAGIEMGRIAIVEEGGIGALVEAIEDGSPKGKEFAVLTLLQLCADSVANRSLLIREGGIPPLVALSQTTTATTKAKHKAETLLGYLRQSRQEASSYRRGDIFHNH